jgi:hypothetical protein
MKKAELNVVQIAATVIGNASGKMNIAMQVIDLKEKCEKEMEAMNVALNKPKALREYEEKKAECKDEIALEEHKAKYPDMEKKIENHLKKIEKLNKEDVSFGFEKFKISEVEKFDIDSYLDGISLSGRQIGVVDFLEMAKPIIDFES